MDRDLSVLTLKSTAEAAAMCLIKINSYYRMILVKNKTERLSLFDSMSDVYHTRNSLVTITLSDKNFEFFFISKKFH